MFRFRPEWQEALGVKDTVLARTWARLEIRAEGDVPERYWPSNLINRAESVQRGVYGSVFPLAEWMIENWWSILYEPCRVPRLSSGRMLAKDSSQRPWVQRHNLLAAREGGSLPDLFLYRDGRHVVVQWFADPEVEDFARPVQFFTEGKILLAPEQAEAALQSLMDDVLARLAPEANGDAARLRENWKALCDSRQTEQDLCAAAAQLGLDPYDPSEVTEDFIATYESKVKALGEELQSDLLQASTASFLDNDVDWVNRALQKVGTPMSPISAPSTRNGLRSAHELGYKMAEAFRVRCGLPPRPVDNLTELLHKKCGWPEEPGLAIDGHVESRLSALVAKDQNGIPHVIGPRVSAEAERFRLARAVYFLPDASHHTAARLVTKAYTWEQRASRAFAAELLAPAQALRDEVRDAVSQTKVLELAGKYKVSMKVIEHQLQNHHIGWTDDD